MKITKLKLRTLGAKAKIFEWEYDIEKGITIHRKFKNKYIITNFSNVDLNQLKKYLSNKEVTCLGNNVIKLKQGLEKEGLGKFVYENLHKSIRDAQAVSQLAAIFDHVGIFNSNGKKINIEFSINTLDWNNFLIYKFSKNKFHE